MVAGGKDTVFRRDINGLRAVAVLAVLLYHFHVPWVAAGYVGVDVFFVISGFLMTQIILGGISRGSFSLAVFYAARARRIIPALTALCLVLLALGWFWLAPADYAILGKHAAVSSGFFSNFIYKEESGYFDSPSQFKWLLHTWSLSAEWQFYLLYPLILLSVAKAFGASGTVMKRTLWGMAAVSLALSVFYSPARVEFAFYLLPTRIWEMVAGGLVFLHARPGKTATARWELPGLALILAAVFLYDEAVVWPGYLALLPVAGAAMILYGGGARLLAVRPMQAIGTLSYSLYLWHWPVTVAWAYFSLAGAGWIAAGIILSFLLALISYHAVEKPLRRAWPEPRRALVAAVVATAVVMGAGYAVKSGRGFPWRVSEAVRIADDEAFNYTRDRDRAGCGFDRATRLLPDCVLGESPQPNPPYMLVGDSHAGALLPAALDAAGSGGMHYYGYSCLTLFDTELRSKSKRRDHCPDFNRAVLEKIRAMPENGRVIVVNRYSYHLHGPNEGERKIWGIDYQRLSPEEAVLTPDALYTKRLGDTLCAMHAIRPVSAVLPIPEMGVDVPKKLARALMLIPTVPDMRLPLVEYEARQQLALQALHGAAMRCGIRLLDPLPFLCPDGKSCMGSQGGRPLYYDDDHLSAWGSRFLTPLLREGFGRLPGGD